MAISRREILVTFGTGVAGMTLLNKLFQDRQQNTFPVLFTGHGSPMNMVENNKYTHCFKELGQKLEKPRAILAVSAHWLTRGTEILAAAKPRQIYDFSGFPKPLYDIKYSPEGDPDLAHAVAATQPKIRPTETWGLDHGTWAVLHHMYPQQDIPVLQLSIDRTIGPKEHLALAKELGELRHKGVLIIGSGNIVHNLQDIDWDPEGKPRDWALEYEELVLSTLTNQNLSVDEKLDKIVDTDLLDVAHPTVDHLIPLIYALGMADAQNAPAVAIRGIQNASVSMATVVF